MGLSKRSLTIQYFYSIPGLFTRRPLRDTQISQLSVLDLEHPTVDPKWFTRCPIRSPRGSDGRTLAHIPDLGFHILLHEDGECFRGGRSGKATLNRRGEGCQWRQPAIERGVRCQGRRRLSKVEAGSGSSALRMSDNNNCRREFAMIRIV